MPTPPPADNSSAVPVIPLDYAPTPQAQYTVGTLAYSRSALLKVCSWLLVADIGLAFRGRALGPMIQLLLKGMGASNQLIAWATVTIPQGLSLVLNPLVAYHSDRYRSRWGRRLPFIFVTVPILTVTVGAMGFSPWLGRYLHGSLGGYSPGERTCGLIAFVTIFMVFDLAAIVQGRTWGGLVVDTVPQKVMGRFSAIARGISLGAGIIFNQFLLARVKDHQLLAFIILSVLYGSTMVVLVLNIREGEYPAPPPRDPSGSARKTISAIWGWGFLKECFGHPFYRWLVVMLCIDDIAFAAVNTFSLLHSQSLNLSLQTYGTCQAIQYVIALVLAYPIGMLADRFHPFRVSAVALLLYGLGAVWSGFYIHDRTTFIIGFMAHGVFATTYNTSAASMGYRLLDPARFTVLSAGSGIVGTFLHMILTPVLGYILDLSQNQYRYCYMLGAGYVLLGIPLYIIVYRKFLALGGPDGYIAPTSAAAANRPGDGGPKPAL